MKKLRGDILQRLQKLFILVSATSLCFAVLVFTNITLYRHITIYFEDAFEIYGMIFVGIMLNISILAILCAIGYDLYGRIE